MDRIITITGFAVFYSLVSIANIVVNTPPPDLSSKKKWDYLGQHVSLIHAFLATFIAFSVYLLEGGVHYNTPTNFYHIIVLGHSLGYFIYDMFYAEFFKLHDWAMRTHHICVLIGGILLYLASIGGSQSTICILITEGPNSFMMLRKILRAKKLQNTKTYEIIEITFAGSFVFLRSIMCTWLNYNIWVSTFPLITKLAISITYGVGLFWVNVIMGIAIERLPPYSPIKETVKRGLEFISKNQLGFAVGIFIWSVIIPYYMTQFLHFGFMNLVIGGFIVF
ncbi:hypothetical protein SteCoe_8076 [Stentor coeruleus]|uniref:TLC domain-containing protein n=1 Tax=Stentor coeruleus TaxID=5963 RepID=A0A1R2CL50_9CILI|nr:hypothetical protein SteCoe_8076 [Stentor coeruleus]